jgi:hypothetical protein
MRLERHRRLKIAAVIVALFSVPVAVAEVYLDKIATSHPAIHWFEGPFDNPVERLQEKLNDGTAKLEYRDEKLTYLPGLLENFGISPESQALVFSKTSFQSTKISPQNPRAVYFTDDVAVGFVRGTDLIEIAATDNRQGVQFYTLTQKQSEKPRFEHRDVCIQCHQGPATSGIPGIFIGSAIPNQAGNIAPEGAIITDHRTKFEDRWGGWFITAKSGQVKDRSNSFATNPSEPDVLDSSLGQNLRTLSGFKVSDYLRPTSDIVALMTFEHQTQMVNYLIRAGWEQRIVDHGGPDAERTAYQLNADIEQLVQYMLFGEEVPLKEPLQGMSAFTKIFPERGPRDHKGRSLRDFDLQTRLFRYPLSFVIYTPLFDAMPEKVRDRVLHRLDDVLTGKDHSEPFQHLKATDRQAILEILADTKPNLPAWWNAASAH